MEKKLFIKNSSNIAIVTENSEISYTVLLKTIAFFPIFSEILTGKGFSS